MIRLPIIIIGTLIALLLFGYLNQHRGKTTITIEIIIIILSSITAITSFTNIIDFPKLTKNIISKNDSLLHRQFIRS